jgi:hypothetical protein
MISYAKELCKCRANVAPGSGFVADVSIKPLQTNKLGKLSVCLAGLLGDPARAVSNLTEAQ